MSTIVSKIIYVQEVFSISNSYLASILGYTPTIIRNIKNGKRNVSIKFVERLATFLEVPIDTLLDDGKELIINKDDTFPNSVFLTNLRINSGYTQTELSKAIGVPITTIASMEKCSNTPSYKLLSKYSHFFHISLINLLKNNY
ncbi:MAG: transcriptional regulator [Bacilli bacterium]|nr:transcriptional regulator [Bacilli bacterium]